jgi:hypothetical protein
VNAFYLDEYEVTTETIRLSDEASRVADAAETLLRGI